MYFKFLFASLLALSGCVAKGPALDQSNSAELTFAREDDQKGFPGWFEQLDGVRIDGSPRVIRVPAGTHTIVYNCPNTVSMDYRPEVSADFVAGERYVLECGANVPGTVLKR